MKASSNLPLVSVVVPSYNHKDFVAQAIKSILNQTYPRIELIVIDDGSIDGTAEIIEELRAENPFRYIRKANSGLLRSLNLGLREAAGEFFCELASDDFLPSDSIEKRARFLIEHPECGAVFGDGVVVDRQGKQVEPLLRPRNKRLCRSDFPMTLLLEGARPIMATGLLRRELLIELGGFDEEFAYYEDLDTPIRLAQVTKLGFLDETLIYYRKHGANTSSQELPAQREKLLLYLKLMRSPSLESYRTLIRKRASTQALNVARSLRKLSRHKEALGAVNTALRHTPWRMKCYLLGLTTLAAFVWAKLSQSSRA